MRKERLFYLDNLKIFLTLLVILHHVGQPYGGSNGFWYFISDEHINLGRFFSVNASFFMSLFFFISSYFLPTSVEKKGVNAFLYDRVKRLGIPLLFGFLIIMPTLMYFYYIHYRSYGFIPFLEYYFHIYLGFGEKPGGWTGPAFPDMQLGHLWFIEHLLVYSLIYVVVKKIFLNKNIFLIPLGNLTNIKLLIISTLVSLITFIVRIFYPIDHWEGLLGFIQVEYAHIPQYVAFYLLGIIAFRNNWIYTMSVKVGIMWLVVGLSLAFLRYFTDLIPFSQGGLNNSNIIYSFCETFLCFGLSFGLIFLFKKVLYINNFFTQMLSDSSYAVYICHLPIAVFIQYVFSTINIIPTIKFATVSILTIILTYLFCIMVRKIKIVRSII